MTAKGKKTAIILGSLFAIIGVGIYFFVKKKKESKNEMPTNPSDAAIQPSSIPPPSVTPPSVVASLPVAPALPPSSPTESERPLVSAQSLLAGDLNAGFKKGLYANFNNLAIYSMDTKVAFKTKKGQRLGMVYSAEKTPQGNIWVYFIGLGGVKYKAIATGMSIK